MPIPAGFVEETEIPQIQTIEPVGKIPDGFVEEDKIIPEIRQAPLLSTFDKMINFFRDPERDIAKAQNIYALSEVTGLPLREVNKNYETLRYSTKVTGLTHDLNNKEFMNMIMLPLVATGAVTNPIGTAAGLIAFGALNKAIPTDKFIDNLKERGIDDNVTNTIELADFIGKSMIVGGVFHKAPKLAEGFFKQKIVDYKMPETIKLSAKQVRDVFQTGTLTTAEQQSLFSSLELSSFDRRAALEHGIDINIPAEKIITLIDKPYWAKIKGIFGIKPQTEITKLPIEKPIKAVSGLLEAKPQTISPELQPLIEEAKKYKTVEEFVKAQKQAFHGSAIEGLEKIEFGEGVRSNTFLGTTKKVNSGAIFFTPNKEVAQFFADNRAEWLKDMKQEGKATVYERFLNIKNPLDLTDIEKADKFFYDNNLTNDVANVIGVERIGDEGLKEIFEETEFDLTDLWQIFDKKELVSKIKNLGYDGAIFQEQGGRGISYAIFNPEQAFTKSQLTSIWQQAQAIPPEKLPPPQPSGDPVQKVISALKEARSVRKEQETLYTKARAQKFAKMQAVGEKVRGEKGYYAQLGALKGELPKVEFEAIRDKLTQEDIDSLFNIVKDSPKIGEWEKLSAREGLAKLFGEFGGKVPTENEISLLNQVFGEEFTKAILDKKSNWEKIKYAINQTINIPKSLMASFDLSAPFRQGIFLIGRPRQFWSSFKRMFGAFKSEDAFKAIQDTIIKDPDFQLARDSKLALTEMDVLLNEREEAFLSSWAEKIPLIGKGVKASNRAYAGFLNKLRFDVFKDLIDKAELAGFNARENRDLSKAIADFVNNASGRGTLPLGLQRAAVSLNTFFFSPRLAWSRINLLNPIYYIKQPPFVRKEAFKSLLAFIGFGTIILTLAKMAGIEVGTDPRSSDFGKMKIGNTRIDIWGGFQQIIVMASRIITGKIVSSTTGKEMTLGEGYKPMTRADIIQHFIESKEAPVASFITALLKGQDATGEKIDVPKEVAQRFIPMSIQDIYEVLKDNPSLLPISLWGIFGVGIQTYEEKSRKGF